MSPDHHDDLPLGLRLLMLAGVAGGATGPLDHVLDRIPSAVLAAVLAVIGGLVLEILRPLARAHGERVARRITGPQPAVQQPPPPPPASET